MLGRFLEENIATTNWSVERKKRIINEKWVGQRLWNEQIRFPSLIYVFDDLRFSLFRKNVN